MNKIKSFFKNLKWSHVLLAIAYILFGLALLFALQTVKDKIGDMLGITLVIIGLIHITRYFMEEMEKSYFSNNFMEGVILVLLGILAIYQNEPVQTLVPYMLAIAVVGSGVSKLQDAIDDKRMGDTHSALFLILGIISLVLGSIVMFNMISDEALMYQILAAGLLYSGATDLFSAIYLSSKYGDYLRGEVNTAPAEPEEHVQIPETPAVPEAPVVPEAPEEPTVMDAPIEPTAPVEEAPAEETPADSASEEPTDKTE